MIAYLKGMVRAKGVNWILLVVEGVGYKVFCSPLVWAETRTGAAMELYCHEVLRQDGRELYGLRTFEELELFEVLISVSGVGPKSALAILTLGNPRDVQSAIARGESGFFTRVSGIGKKTAERLLLELKDRFVDDGACAVVASGGSDDVVAALVQLGYAKREAETAAAAAGNEGRVEERLKRALRNC